MLEHADTVLGIVQKLAFVFAALLGLIWFKLRYTKRDFHVHSRIKLTVDAHIVHLHGRTYLRVISTMKNVGLTGHRILHDGENGTYLCLYLSEEVPPADTAITVRWGEGAYFDAFEKLTWLSPNEVVREELLLALPETPLLALKVEVGVVKGSQRPWKDEKILFRDAVESHRSARTRAHVPEAVTP